MKYNINKISDYLNKMIGNDINLLPTEKEAVAKLPFTLANNYNFHDMEIIGNRITVAVPTEPDECSPMQLSKHQAKMMDVFEHTVVFALEEIESYNLTRLTRARVNFIVPNKIIFIPSLMMVLKEVRKSNKTLPDTMPPVAQLILLYHIQVKNLNGMTTAKLANIVSMAYPTINVALRWLERNDFIELMGRKQKYVKFVADGKELWKKALPLMTSPIECTIYADTKPLESLLANETAMGHYTMLAEPNNPIVAISKATAKKYSSLFNKQYGDVKIEVWKYAPSLLSENEYVDRLSLYLCLKDSNDERVQIECDTLIEEMKW